MNQSATKPLSIDDIELIGCDLIRAIDYAVYHRHAFLLRLLLSAKRETDRLLKLVLHEREGARCHGKK